MTAALSPRYVPQDPQQFFTLYKSVSETLISKDSRGFGHVCSVSLMFHFNLLNFVKSTIRVGSIIKSFRGAKLLLSPFTYEAALNSYT